MPQKARGCPDAPQPRRQPMVCRNCVVRVLRGDHHDAGRGDGGPGGRARGGLDGPVAGRVRLSRARLGSGPRRCDDGVDPHPHRLPTPRAHQQAHQARWLSDAGAITLRCPRPDINTGWHGSLPDTWRCPLRWGRKTGVCHRLCPRDMALETRRRRVCRDPMTYSGMFSTASTCKPTGTGLEICCAATAILRYRPPMR